MKIKFFTLFVALMVALSANAVTYTTTLLSYSDLASMSNNSSKTVVIGCAYSGTGVFIGCNGSSTATATNGYTTAAAMATEANALANGTNSSYYKFTLAKNSNGYTLQANGKYLYLSTQTVGPQSTASISWDNTSRNYTLANTTATSNIISGISTANEVGFYYASRSGRSQTSYLSGNNGLSTATSTSAATVWQVYEVAEVAGPTLSYPTNGSTEAMGNVDMSETFTKQITVKGTSLTKDLTVSVSGDGFSVSPTTISADDANAGTTVTVTFAKNVKGTYTGTLTIASEEATSTINLTATVVSEDDAATVVGQLSSWTDNYGSQEVGYAGLGNSNEVLASALVNYGTSAIPSVKYRLYGQTSKYVKTIKLWARKRDTNQDYTSDNSSTYPNYENTFAHFFDYRDPAHSTGSVLIASTTEIPAVGTTATLAGNASLDAGEYVFYLTADIKSEDEIGGLSELPLIGNSASNFTRIGGKISQVICGDAATYTINCVNNYSADGGGRVIVPKFQILYAPRYATYASDSEYSNFYRIPAIATAADGSLLALSDARKDHIHDVTNNIDIVARRSTDNGKTWGDYVVIFEGTKTGDDCANWSGYGDAAVATFSNGTAIATAIHGYGLNGTSSNAASNVVWKVSHDNGKSWGTENTMEQSVYGNLRGCISPGQICVPTSGYLKGKALAALRTSTSPNYGKSASASYQRIYFMVYDPETNAWSNVTINGSNYYIEKSSSSGYDEAQFVEVGENSFVLSIRSYDSSDSFRAYQRVTFTSATTATSSSASKSGMTLKVGSNGGVINYTAQNSSYVLQTVPKDMMYNGDNCRSGLSVYYANKSTSGTLAWTRSLDVFDPFDNGTGGATGTGIGGLNETAQYSSITEQNDESVGILMEAYPLAVRHIEDVTTTYTRHWGDWVMAQYYINLRIGDIVPNETPIEKQAIDAPEVTPNSATYDSNSAASRPNVTISQANYSTHSDLYNTTDAQVNTYYTFEYFDENGKLQASSAATYFTGETQSFTWEQVWTALGYSSDPVDGDNGSTVRVNAYCVSANDNTVISTTTTQTYTFDTPVRNIKVVPVPAAGANSVAVITTGSSVEANEWLTVGISKDVTINAPANADYKFSGFYYTIDGVTYQLSDKLSYENISGIAHQIKFSSPAETTLANNYDDGTIAGIVIEARYTVNAGLMMDGEYRSTFLPAKLDNTYKNTIKLTGNITEGEDYDGKTFTITRTAANSGATTTVATVTLNRVNSAYTYTVTYPEDAWANNTAQDERYDTEATVNSGNLTDGINVVDYFKASTSNGGDKAGSYTYTMVDDNVEQNFVVPVYAATTTAYLVTDRDAWRADQNVVGYTLAEINSTDEDEEQILDLPQGVAAAHSEFYNNDIQYHSLYSSNELVKKFAIGDNETATLPYYQDVDITDGNTELSYCYGMHVNSTYGENTYGTNLVEIPVVSLDLTSSNFQKTSYTFHSNSHYFYCENEITFSQTQSTFTTEGGGYRVWRICDDTDEIEEKYEGRATNYMFYKGMGLTEHTETVSGVGTKVIEEGSTKSDKDWQMMAGHFGAKGDNPTAIYTVRAYYKAVPTTKASMLKEEAEEYYYVAEFTTPVLWQNGVVTDVTDVTAAKNIAGVRYYNVAGQCSNTPFDGMNIVVTTYTDGSTSSEKVMK